MCVIYIQRNQSVPYRTFIGFGVFAKMGNFEFYLSASEGGGYAHAVRNFSLKAERNENNILKISSKTDKTKFETFHYNGS